jgi:hypothetical protein
LKGAGTLLPRQTVHETLCEWWFEFLEFQNIPVFDWSFSTVPDLIRFIALAGSQSIQNTRSGIIAAAFILGYLFKT